MSTKTELKLTRYFVPTSAGLYLCWVDDLGRIVETACYSRWRRSGFPAHELSGNPFLSNLLQVAVDELTAVDPETAVQMQRESMLLHLEHLLTFARIGVESIVCKTIDKNSYAVVLNKELIN